MKRYVSKFMYQYEDIAQEPYLHLKLLGYH
jgi:hypothetical protein